MITELELMFGGSKDADPLIFAPGSVTVFVGPNNSGKSLVLREIGSALFDPTEPRFQHMMSWQGYIAPSERRIVRRLKVPEPGWDRIRSYFENVDSMGMSYVGSLLTAGPQAGHINMHQFLKGIEQENRPDLMAPARLMVLRSQVEILDGQRRLNLVDSRPMGNLKQAPTNILQALFRDDARRHRLADMTKEAFDMYLVIDPTGGGQLQMAMSAGLPRAIEEERSLSEKAIRFFSDATPIAETSDGVKAYSGILAAVLSTDLKVILIDEPDAFLHPPLARRLGSTLTNIASERDGNVLASTHDSNFLMGSIQAGKPVNVVRLTYRDGAATAGLLEAGRLRNMMRDPLLRSTRVMDALFHQGAFVCEADADRAFYQEINDRLLGANQGAVTDCIFLNAQNKQTVRRIVGPLRDMGIPAAAVVDLDIVKKGTNNDLRDLMEAAYVPDGLIKTYGQLRGEIEAAFSAKHLVSKRAGIDSLDSAQRETAQVLLRDLGEYGVFLVPVGELERWLPSLGVPSDTPEQKRAWLPLVFDQMGSDPDEAGYIKPSDDDVWSFVQQIGRWVADPFRKGMP